MKLLIATRNPGKFREISEGLSELPLELVSPEAFPRVDPVEEDQPTFRGNALKKAREICRQTGLLTLADDSGIVVNALEGEPGVHSARYGGESASDEENLGKLLKEMQNIPEGKRQAHYFCSLVLKSPDGREFETEGICHGEIAREPRGAGGFGYDPIFILPEYGKTMAEIPPSQKNRISHRGKALEKMIPVVSSYLACARRGF